MTVKLKKALEISEMKSSPLLKKLDAKKFVGVLKLKKDPLLIQKELQNE